MVVDEPMLETRLWWLSFADPARPKGQQFLGVSVVRAESFTQAVFQARSLGINPGGQVQGFEVESGTIPEGDIERLLSRDEALILSEQV